ncbi:MAG: hypothetical protein KUA37_05480 [Desulfomicrobium sp.]|nr:hypothetical protein [Pseudomonadota bacterium]MBV1711442.1 hypothetical protein [Desulfomicrobium sp.]MBU4570844.1 hypothetical protein [Pseudomonadota bacterium]MBU4595334.1 hypothetical protein [Pseudomonadota bacterium]MBV1720766.1 hypothetical protein [Desulfomicrobium sp.]
MNLPLNIKALCILTVLFLLSSQALASRDERNLSASLYGGVMTDDNWHQSLSGQASPVDSHILVGAMGWTFYRPANRLWSLELEANVARHFGIQDNFEFNAPILTVRWDYFPWDKILDTSLAYGLGPSYATKLPEYERQKSGDSEQLLLFWHIEAAFGLPESNWSTIFRLHHRSSGYGMFADKGGSNILTMGLRYEF